MRCTLPFSRIVPSARGSPEADQSPYASACCLSLMRGPARSTSMVRAMPTRRLKLQPTSGSGPAGEWQTALSASPQQPRPSQLARISDARVLQPLDACRSDALLLNGSAACLWRFGRYRARPVANTARRNAIRPAENSHNVNSPSRFAHSGHSCRNCPTACRDQRKCSPLYQRRMRADPAQPDAPVPPRSPRSDGLSARARPTCS